ncbi:hypothetical protein TL16_g11909 [Triparma laevis f. inornata]|uniref:Uncharacterized protein n=1 Tax=Triparma laevis f. inornata TaxID=1714386 RepID=A0A9W7ES94_9STRA|nr:hypothetical protein TL16_g11909 [Triparma laevis f. inornata]
MPTGSIRGVAPAYLLPSLFLSYVAVYFCMSDLTVISPILDLSPSALGTLISVGTAIYGIGKLLSGATAIKRPWLRIHVCMVMAGVFTICFASSSEYVLLLLFWSLNRFAQSLIWTTLILLVHLHYGRGEVGKAACAVPTTEASMLSVVFPVFGALFTMAAGCLSDKISGKRGGVIMACMVVAGVSLLMLTLVLTSGTPNGLLVLVLISGSAALLGPYSLLSALSIDVCSVEGREDLLPLFQGLQDGAGYFFASISGALVGNVVEHGGWAVGIGVLLGFHVFACVFTGLYARGEGKGGVKVERRVSEFELVISDEVDEAFTIGDEDEDEDEEDALV